MSRIFRVVGAALKLIVRFRRAAGWRSLVLASSLAVSPAPVLAEGQAGGSSICPVERAVYEMTVPDTDETWRVVLVPSQGMASIASDLYLKLATPQRDYWFIFSVSQGYSGISIFPVTDPYAENGPRDLLGPPFGDNDQAENTAAITGSLRILFLDADLNVAFEPPMSGEAAPPFIMMPEIGLALWYDAVLLTDDPGADRDPMPRGVFKRTECLVAPPLKAKTADLQ